MTTPSPHLPSRTIGRLDNLDLYGGFVKRRGFGAVIKNRARTNEEFGGTVSFRASGS